MRFNIGARAKAQIEGECRWGQGQRVAPAASTPYINTHFNIARDGRSIWPGPVANQNPNPNFEKCMSGCLTRSAGLAGSAWLTVIVVRTVICP